MRPFRGSAIHLNSLKFARVLFILVHDQEVSVNSSQTNKEDNLT